MTTRRLTHGAMVAAGVLLCAVALGGCWYGFAGGGLPRNVRTAAVLPFDNETISSELPMELAEALREGLERRLGLRPSSEDNADLLVQGKIRQYDVDIPVAISADRQNTASRRRLAVSIDIRMINQRTGAVLWEKNRLVAEGEYSDRGEAAGRKQAIDRIVSDIVEGAQSQW